MAIGGVRLCLPGKIGASNFANRSRSDRRGPQRAPLAEFRRVEGQTHAKDAAPPRLWLIAPRGLADFGPRVVPPTVSHEYPFRVAAVQEIVSAKTNRTAGVGPPFRRYDLELKHVENEVVFFAR
jgi:hypothetical protein